MSETAQPKAIDYGLDKTRWVLESFEYTDKNNIDDLKTAFDNKIKQWFDADIGEISEQLTKEQKNKLTKIQTTLTKQLQDAKNEWETETKIIKTGTNKLNQETKQKLDNLITNLEANAGLQELMKTASESDPNSSEYTTLEQTSDNATETIDTKITEKMNTVGKLGDFLAHNFLDISLVDLIKNPDSPYGAILRNFPTLVGLEKGDLKEKDLQMSFNPFAQKFLEKQSELEQSGNANINVTPDLNEKDNEANSILNSLRKYKICDGLIMDTYEKKDQKMTFKAKNWNQIVFLRKFLPHTAINSTFDTLKEKAKNRLWTLPEITNNEDDSKNNMLNDIFTMNKDEYKASEKKNYPDIVAVNSNGFDIEVSWNTGQNFFNTVVNGIDSLNPL